jgi:transcriptional regulator with XRE-family HTH domain
VGFGELLRTLRTARGISQAAVAAGAGLDRSYVNRIEAGERGAPAGPAVEALIGALRLTPAEADRLTAAAGLLPHALRILGPDDPTLLLLAGRLADPALTPATRAALRSTVELLVRHWGEAGEAGGSEGTETAERRQRAGGTGRE